MTKKCDCLRCKHSGQCDSATGYCNGFEPIYETNADRIRAMSDDELSVFLPKVKADYQWADPDFPDIDDDWMDWLQSEVEE